MRLFTLLCAMSLTQPASAWEAGRDGALCTLTHSEAGAEVRLTFDPGGPIYTIAVTRPDPWPPGSTFAMQFDGPRSLTIRTSRHVLSDENRTVSVTDRGFGNVLDGLQFNETATSFLGDATVAVSLEGAAPEVAAFRACEIAPSA